MTVLDLLMAISHLFHGYDLTSKFVKKLRERWFFEACKDPLGSEEIPAGLFVIPNVTSPKYADAMIQILRHPRTRPRKSYLTVNTYLPYEIGAPERAFLTVLSQYDEFERPLRSPYQKVRIQVLAKEKVLEWYARWLKGKKHHNHTQFVTEVCERLYKLASDKELGNTFHCIPCVKDSDLVEENWYAGEYVVLDEKWVIRYHKETRILEVVSGKELITYLCKPFNLAATFYHDKPNLKESETNAITSRFVEDIVGGS